mgnify:FL=1
MTTTEHAAEIRETLKREHSWTSRQVSVRAEHYSMGSSIHVEVKDPAIPLPVVKAVAEKAEDIRRDGFGEILSGGNRYVSVRYSSEAMTIIGRRYADAVQRAVNAIDGARVLRPVEGTPFFVGQGNYGFGLTLWEDSFLSQANTVDGIAEAIGCLMVAREGEDSSPAVLTMRDPWGA